jgi:hypothetical protein
MGHLIDCRSDNEGSKKQPFGGQSPPKGPMKFFRSQNTLCTIQEWVGGQSKLSSTSEMTIGCYSAPNRFTGAHSQRWPAMHSDGICPSKY